jgi:hypothetical protein
MEASVYVLFQSVLWICQICGRAIAGALKSVLAHVFTDLPYNKIRIYNETDREHFLI